MAKPCASNAATVETKIMSDVRDDSLSGDDVEGGAIGHSPKIPLMEQAWSKLRRAFSHSQSKADRIPSRRELRLWGHRGRPLPETQKEPSSEAESSPRRAAGSESEDESLSGRPRLPGMERTRNTFARLARMKAVKGRPIKVKDMRELLQYLRSDLDDGIGPRSYHLEAIDADLYERESAQQVYCQSRRALAFFRDRRKSDSEQRRARQLPNSTTSILAKFDAEVATAVDSRELRRQDRSKWSERALYTFFCAVQGVLAGYAAAVASIEYVLDDDKRLVEHYGQVSNLFRRWGFVLATMALVGALNKFQVAYQDRANWKQLDPLARIEMRTLVVFYLGAFVLSLASSNVDVTLSSDFRFKRKCTQNDAQDEGCVNDDDPHWQDSFHKSGLMSLSVWRTNAWIRFLLATAGWLLSCGSHDRLLRQTELAQLKVSQLRDAIARASLNVAHESNTDFGHSTVPQQRSEGARSQVSQPTVMAA